MKRNTFEYFDYEPSDHTANRRSVLSSFIVLLVCLTGIFLAH